MIDSQLYELGLEDHEKRDEVEKLVRSFFKDS